MGAEQIIVGEKLVTVNGRVATNVGGKIISYSSHTNTPGCLYDGNNSTPGTTEPGVELNQSLAFSGAYNGIPFPLSGR